MKVASANLHDLGPPQGFEYMLRAVSHLPANHGRGASIDTITLAHDERRLRRKLLTCAGGTEVMVYGHRFRDTSQLYCWFGNNDRALEAVPVKQFINTTHVGVEPHCPVPGCPQVHQRRISRIRGRAVDVKHERSRIVRRTLRRRDQLLHDVRPGLVRPHENR